MIKPEPVHCATCGGDIEHAGSFSSEPLPGKDFNTLIQNQALHSMIQSNGWVHMKTEYDPELQKVTRFQHVERDAMHPAVPHDGRTPELNTFIKNKITKDTSQEFHNLMDSNFPEGYGKGVQMTKPCRFCGTPVDSDIHEEEGGMCVDCSHKYYNHELEDKDELEPDMYQCRVCGKNSSTAEENMNHRCFE